MAGQIGNENAMLGGERRRERPPVLDRPAEPVHEDERRTGAADHVAEPRPAPLELAFLESLEPGFAVRPH